MGTGRVPVVCTDPLVFEAFDKGDFHASYEILLDSVKNKRWSYAELLLAIVHEHTYDHPTFGGSNSHGD
ncbi:pentatricopeptide repeat-containing protein [Carex littledalei]|uniref:Pentatricopeptide repeat-containing protein n=1 Tax=Carex littledalei TaxID=544730 RepID=A0A833VX08_9POAL|nr:pentatricopeptide repeat-containing protein [Carex littledalei]